MGVCCYRYEYEIISQKETISNWTAFIAAFSSEEAQRHLQKIVGKPMRILTSGMQCRVDDVSSEVRQNIINAYLAINPQGIGQQNDVTKPDKNEVEKPESERPSVVGKTPKK